jgi:hypothetical protein
VLELARRREWTHRADPALAALAALAALRESAITATEIWTGTDGPTYA